MSIVTRSGDDGSTALMFGRRVPKDHPRVEAYGAVDELSASLGLARAAAPEPNTAAWLIQIQRDLIVLMGELAVSPEDRDRYQKQGFRFVSTEMVETLDGWVRELESRLPKAEGWAVPGAAPSAAALDMARAVCRRAERRVRNLGEDVLRLNPSVIAYLNRLGDLLWLMARGEESRRQ